MAKLFEWNGLEVAQWGTRRVEDEDDDEDDEDGPIKIDTELH